MEIKTQDLNYPVVRRSSKPMISGMWSVGKRYALATKRGEIFLGSMNKNLILAIFAKISGASFGDIPPSENSLSERYSSSVFC